MTTLAEIRQKYPQYQDLSDEQLAGALYKKFYSDMPPADFAARVGIKAPSVTPQAGPLASLGDLALGIGSQGVMVPVAGLAGLGAAAGNKLGVTNANPSDVIESVSGLAYQPRTEAGQKASAAIAWPFEKLAQGADWTGGKVAEATDSPGFGAAVNTAIQAAPAVLLRSRGTRPASRSLDASEGRPSPAPKAPSRQAGLGGVPPTIEELAAQSKAAYKAASDAGANISPASFKNLKNRVNVLLKKEGIDSTLHPKASAALNRFNKTDGPVSLDDFDTLRKIANDARASVDKADSHMAARIIDEMDDFANNLSPKDASSPAAFGKLKEARNLYSRKAKAEEIAELVRRAELSAPNFSASGAENALRTEFRNLAKNKNRMRRFTPEERAAIEKVAKGGPLENTLRFIGKFAPTGFISTAFGGVLTGATGGIGAIVPATGMAARYGATKMTRKSAQSAEELMRRGPPQKARPPAKPHIRPKRPATVE